MFRPYLLIKSSAFRISKFITPLGMICLSAYCIMWGVRYAFAVYEVATALATWIVLSLLL